MAEPTPMKRRESNLLPLLAGLCICAVVAGGIVLMIWGVDTCDRNAVKDSLLASGRTGCAEFWLNRYQGLIGAVLQTVIALGAAFLVLRQLRVMAEQNALSQAALRLAEKEHHAGERKKLNEAIEITHQLYGLWSVIILAVGDAVKARNEDQIRRGYTDQYKSLTPTAQEFRMIVPHVLSTHEERAAYREYEERSSASSMYFFVGHARVAGLSSAKAEAAIPNLPKNLDEALIHIYQASKALWRLGQLLSARLENR